MPARLARAPVLPVSPLPSMSSLPVHVVRFDVPGADLVLINHLFSHDVSQELLLVLRRDIPWSQQSVTVHKHDGPTQVLEPRFTSFMADVGVQYSYSGKDNTGVGWSKPIFQLKCLVENALARLCGLQGIYFNAVQLNMYIGNHQSLGLHADDEPDLDPNSPIASVSFGVPRDFTIARKDNRSSQWSLKLQHGSLLVMSGNMQKLYVHGVPCGFHQHEGARFNLTFRVCRPRETRNAT